VNGIVGAVIAVAALAVIVLVAVRLLGSDDQGSVSVERGAALRRPPLSGP
jgi:hypothetical protein